MWDYPSIDAIADYLIEQLGNPVTGIPTSKGAVLSAPGSVVRGSEATPMAPLDEMSDQEVTALLNQLIADERAGASL